MKRSPLVLALAICPLRSGMSAEPVAQENDAERPQVSASAPTPSAPPLPPSPLLLIDAQSGRRVVGYRTQPRYGMIVTGSILLTAGLAASIGAGVEQHLSLLPVPLVGPFLEVPKMAAADGGGPLFAAVLVLDGLAQLGGVTLVIIGAVTKQRLPILSNVAPMATVGGGGLTFQGRF
jgi:hypothetical protein